MKQYSSTDEKITIYQFYADRCEELFNKTRDFEYLNQKKFYTSEIKEMLEDIKRGVD